MKYRLIEICAGITDGSHNPPAGGCKSDYMMISSKNVFDDEITLDDPRYLTEDQFNQENKRTRVASGDVLMTIVGTVGRTAVVPNDFANITLQRSVAVLHPNNDICKSRYLMYLLRAKRQYFESEAHGVAQKGIYLKQLSDVMVDIPEIAEQTHILDILDHLQKVIFIRKQELIQLNEIIKARFVEMFGDPTINSYDLETKPMTEVCDIIDGDRGKNYPTADDFSDEGYCLFLNAKNVTAAGFSFETCMFVTKEKDEALRKGKLSRGDVVLTTRGTLGNLAFYTDDVPFNHVRINSGMVILRMKRDIIDEVYFIEQFKMQLTDIKEKIASGSAQPQLPISTMNKIQILIPNIEKQRAFATFVAQVDKSKAAVQKSLDETQVLFDSLMQKYFG